MAKARQITILELDELETALLKKLLGGMNNSEFAELGIKGDDRDKMSYIWSLLPDAENE